MIRAVQYVRSVPRYLLVRFLGPHLGFLYTSRLGCLVLRKTPWPPLPGPGWVRVRPRLSGVCGSDLATLTARGGTYFSPFSSFPFTLGHEVVGEIWKSEAGWEKGERVLLEPPLTCSVRTPANPCPYCRAGRRALCVHVRHGPLAAGIQTGYCRDTGGGWSEGFVAHASQLHRVPEGLADQEAVLVEPLSCALEAVKKVRPGDDEQVLILGCGTMGCMTLLALRGLGCRCRIVVVAKHPYQQESARRLGADIIVGTHDVPRGLAEALQARLYKPEFARHIAVGGADSCFDCVGSDRSLDDALRFTCAGGRVILVGMPGVPRGVDWTSIWHKELMVRGSYTCERGTFQEAMELAAQNRNLLRGLVGEVFPLNRWREAVQTALNAGRQGVIKVAISPT